MRCPTAAVATNSASNLLCHAQWGAIHLSDTMRSGTSQPPYSQRYVRGSLWSHTYSPSQGRLSPTTKPTSKTMHGFWGSRFERAFLDVRVFNPSARSNRQTSLQATYKHHELEKRLYEQQVREVEHSAFTPIVLSTTGGMGGAATSFYKRFASMLSEKREVPYSKMMGWICSCLSFALLRASIMSIRGARSSRYHPAMEDPIDL